MQTKALTCQSDSTLQSVTLVTNLCLLGHCWQWQLHGKQAEQRNVLDILCSGSAATVGCRKILGPAVQFSSVTRVARTWSDMVVPKTVFNPVQRSRHAPLGLANGCHLCRAEEVDLGGHVLVMHRSRAGPRLPE